jgi:hypothetical protein
VYDKLIEGYPCSEVARFIQDECKEYTDVTRGSLITQLNDFRSTIPKAEILSKKMPEVLLKAKEQVDKGLEELKELERLYRKQMERIEIDLGTEKQIKKLMPSMTAEIRAAREILESYAQIKMDLGLNTRHLGKVEVDGSISADAIAKFGSEAVARVLAAPESRRKVLSLAQKMLTMSPRAQELLQQEIIDVTVAEPSGPPEESSTEAPIEEQSKGEPSNDS